MHHNQTPKQTNPKCHDTQFPRDMQATHQNTQQTQSRGVNQYLKSQQLIAYLELTLAQAGIGMNIVIAKYLVSHQVPIFILLFLRFLFGSVVSFALVKILKQSIWQNKYGQALHAFDFRQIFWQAACGGFLFNMFMLAGLHYSNATIAGIISSTTPAVIAIFSALILGEILGTKKIISIALAIVGLIIIDLGHRHGLQMLGHTANPYGILLIFIAVFPEAMFTILTKRHQAALSPFTQCFLINLINSILFLPFALYSVGYQQVTLNITDILLLMAYGCCGGLLFFIFWCRGLEKSSASTAALFACIMPISTTCLAYFFLHETITIYQFAGMGFVIFSIVIGAVNLKHFLNKDRE